MKRAQIRTHSCSVKSIQELRSVIDKRESEMTKEEHLMHAWKVPPAEMWEVIVKLLNREIIPAGEANHNGQSPGEV